MQYHRDQAIVYGRHLDVVVRMLDFDYLSGRETPSVTAIIDPAATRVTHDKVFFGEREILIPVYPSLDSLPANPLANTFLNFASYRSAPEVARAAMRSGRFAYMVIVAEGIPERETRDLIAEARERGIYLIGPATAGGLVAGTFRMGNSGGSIDNLLASRLYRSGSIGFVSRSGGMSNELFRVLSRTTDGVHTGIALGGDRFVGMTFLDAWTQYEANPEIRMIVLLGEVGGEDEYAVADMLARGRATKPVVAYVAGKSAEIFSTEVQFGHAGARANS